MREVIIRHKSDKPEGHEIVETVGELIRCGECIHAHEYPTVAGPYIHCWKLGTNSLTHTFYCGLGEKKENDKS